nr:carbohydrate kinase family protein [Candidatus Woesebacteria bacterium]
LPAQVVDETGAGDAFAVGYVTAKRHGDSSDSAIQWALRNSQSVVQHIGATAGLLSLERLSGV